MLFLRLKQTVLVSYKSSTDLIVGVQSAGKVPFVSTEQCSSASRRRTDSSKRQTELELVTNKHNLQHGRKCNTELQASHQQEQ